MMPPLWSEREFLVSGLRIQCFQSGERLIENFVNPGGADEVVLRQTTPSVVDRVRVVTHDTSIVGDDQFWMMILCMNHLGNRINEGQGGVIITKSRSEEHTSELQSLMRI